VTVSLAALRWTTLMRSHGLEDALGVLGATNLVKIALTVGLPAMAVAHDLVRRLERRVVMTDRRLVSIERDGIGVVPFVDETGRTLDVVLEAAPAGRARLVVRGPDPGADPGETLAPPLLLRPDAERALAELTRARAQERGTS
jgi:hypothetical protein